MQRKPQTCNSQWQPRHKTPRKRIKQRLVIHTGVRTEEPHPQQVSDVIGSCARLDQIGDEIGLVMSHNQARLVHVGRPVGQIPEPRQKIRLVFGSSDNRWCKEPPSSQTRDQDSASATGDMHSLDGSTSTDLKLSRQRLWETTEEDGVLRRCESSGRHVRSEQRHFDVCLVDKASSDQRKVQVRAVDTDRACSPAWSHEVLECRLTRLRNQFLLGECLVQVDLERCPNLVVDAYRPQGGDGLEEAVVATVRPLHTKDRVGGIRDYWSNRRIPETKRPHLVERKHSEVPQRSNRGHDVVNQIPSCCVRSASGGGDRKHDRQGSAPLGMTLQFEADGGVKRAETMGNLRCLGCDVQRNWVWTTFSADQIDLNYRSPELFLHVLGVLLDYAAHGASMIRLDAVQFLWKEVGASSINLPQGHQVIQLLRACLDQIYADVIIVTEANVPHLENVSYFGGGDREAQMIYQFPLPPLVLDALHTGDVELLATWLRALDSVPEGRTFLNFLSSHDGVGVRPVEGILPQSRVNDLVRLTRDGGGQVGVRTVGADTAPYELNTTWFSLMETGYGVSDAIDRHLASHAIMLALRGIPAIYALSLVGGRSDQAGFDQTGRARSLNRTRFATEQLAVDLADAASIASRVVHGLEKMLRWRSGTAAFHPDSPQTVLDTPRGVLGIERGTANVAARVYVNVTSEPVDVVWPGAGWVGNEVAPIGGAATITVGPWDSIWLRKDG
jgi:hypothetical protein